MSAILDEFNRLFADAEAKKNAIIDNSPDVKTDEERERAKRAFTVMINKNKIEFLGHRLHQALEDKIEVYPAFELFEKLMLETIEILGGFADFKAG